MLSRSINNTWDHSPIYCDVDIEINSKLASKIENDKNNDFYDPFMIDSISYGILSYVIMMIFRLFIQSTFEASYRWCSDDIPW